MIHNIFSIVKSYGLLEFFLYIFERKLKIRLPINTKLRWKISIKSEIRFWDNCIKTGGLHWPDEYKLRFDSDLPIQKEVRSLLPRIFPF